MIPDKIQSIKTKPHSLTLENRNKLTVLGVSNVESFDAKVIFVVIDSGSMTVKGEGLHIEKLSVESTELSVTGEITSIEYHKKMFGKKNSGLLGKILKNQKG